VRRTSARRREQPARGPALQLLAVGDRPAPGRVDDRPGERAPACDLAADLCDRAPRR
jgi:hypothetical protein